MEGTLPPAAADPALLAAVDPLLRGADGAPDMGAVLVALAAVRPLSGREMARAVEAAAPGALEGREGYLYPLLAEMEREGLLEGRWVEEPGARPRRVYAPPGAEAPSPPGAGGPPSPAPAAPPRLHRSAREAARGIPGAFERESARAEILCHLEASSAAYGRMGLDADAAARCALRDLGDPWKIRVDLGRVHRGRPVVVFPRTLAERFRALAIYDLVPLSIVLAVLLLVRWQVVQAYNIPTKSMEPTLHGEDDHPDFILVDKTVFLRRDPERWDIIVFYPPEERGRPPGAAADPEEEDPSAFVKRCVGLGGESLDLLGGDAYVDGRLARRLPEVEDAMMVPLYDLGRDLRDAARRSRLAPPATLVFDGSWQVRAGAWSLRDGRFAAAPGAEGEARLSFLRDLDNSYDQPDGGTVNSGAPAGDLEVRFVAEGVEAGASVGADLTEGAGDGQERHSLRIGPRGVTLRSGGRTWTSRLARSGPGGPMEVRLRNVDDRLTAWVDGEVVLRVEMPPRTPLPSAPAPGGVELAVEGGRASLGGVRILRDIVYLRAGPESSWPRRIPAGHSFMMGDNTGNSHDSRVWGPVPLDRLVGVPFAIAYPPTRARMLK